MQQTFFAPLEIINLRQEGIIIIILHHIVRQIVNNNIPKYVLYDIVVLIKNRKKNTEKELKCKKDWLLYTPSFIVWVWIICFEKKCFVKSYPQKSSCTAHYYYTVKTCIKVEKLHLIYKLHYFLLSCKTCVFFLM